MPDADANDDTLLHTALAHTTSPLEISLLVIDEAQDLSALYVEFVQHLLRFVPTPPTLLLVGDPFQSIFRYLGASTDYMLCPERYFASDPGVPFERMHLTTCWRITPEMAAWVNTHLHPRHLALTVAPEWWATHGPQLLELWGEGIRAGKPSKPGSVAVMAMDDPAVHGDPRVLVGVASQDCAFRKSVRRASMYWQTSWTVPRARWL